MIQHVIMVQILYLDIYSKLLSGQALHTRNSSHFFWNLKDPVLVRTLPYRGNNNPLLIGFFPKLISMHDVEHNMLHLRVAQQLPLL